MIDPVARPAARAAPPPPWPRHRIMGSRIAEPPPLVRERLHPLPQGTVIRVARRTANRDPAAPKNFNPSALTMEIFQEYFRIRFPIGTAAAAIAADPTLNPSATSAVEVAPIPPPRINVPPIPQFK